MLVLTHGLGASPASAAFLASRPAATITAGLEVLVQLVMEAITTEPWCTEAPTPGSVRSASPEVDRPGPRRGPAGAASGSRGSSGGTSRGVALPPSARERPTSLGAGWLESWSPKASVKEVQTRGRGCRARGRLRPAGVGSVG